jgi:hypothetical protein
LSGVAVDVLVDHVFAEGVRVSALPFAPTHLVPVGTEVPRADDAVLTGDERTKQRPSRQSGARRGTPEPA